MQTLVHTELWYDNDWHDLTDEGRVYTRNPITITRGRARENERVAPSLLNLSIKNNDGKYSIRNPMSALWGKINRNQPVRCWCRLFLDDFSRTVGSGWGFASDGRGWVTGGVGSGSISVGSGLGVQTQTTAAGYQFCFLQALDGNLWRDAEARVRFTLSGTGMPNVAGGVIEPANLILRLVDSINYYFLRIEITTAEAVNISIKKIVANVETTLSSVVLVAGLTFSGQALMASFQAEGAVLSGKVWDPAVGEPVDWQVSAVDTTFPNAGTPGVRTGVASGNTNVPVTASYDNFEVRIPRVYAEVESWPQRWTVDANEDGTRGDVWAPVKCNGLMRRLGGVGSKAPAQSGLRREIEHAAAPVAYWPLDAGRIASAGELALGNGSPFAPISNTVQFGAGDLAPWLEPGVTMDANATMAAAVSGMAANPTIIAVDHIRKGKDGGTGPSVWQFQRPGGNNWIITFTPGAFDEIDVLMLNNGVVVDSTPPTAVSGLFDDQLHYVRFLATQSGGNISWSILVDGIPVLSDTYVATLTGIDEYRLSYNPGSAREPLVFGHAVVYQGSPPINNVTAMLGRRGEQAHVRMQRVAAQEGISITIIGDESAALGPQPIASTLDLFHDAADADGGILYEPRGTFGLAYKTHTSLLNQVRAITLDYAAGGEVAPPLDPTEDTDNVQNDVTVTQVDGGSLHVVQETGPLNVQEPADDLQGVGRYPVDVQLNLETVDQTLQQAAWIKHMGTWDEPRYPAVTMDLTAMDADDKTQLINDASAVDIGDRLAVENPPTWQGPDDIDQHVQGYAETLASHRWMIESNTTPAGPWLIGALGSARLDNPSSTVTDGLFLDGGTTAIASTPDVAALDITGDIDVRVDVTVGAIPGARLLAGKWGAAGQRSWFFYFDGTAMHIFWSNDGTTQNFASSGVLPFVLGQRIAVRWTLDVDNGSGQRVHTWYTAANIDGAWTQVAQVVTAGTTSIFASTADLQVGIGLASANSFPGAVHAVEVRNGIGGTAVANPRFTSQATGTTSFADSAGRTWSVGGSAEIVDTPTTTATKVMTASPVPGTPWSTAGAPYDIVASGERMTVTSVAGTERVQVLTVTRSINSVVKTHAAGTELHTYRPLRLARGA